MCGCGIEPDVPVLVLLDRPWLIPDLATHQGRHQTLLMTI